MKIMEARALTEQELIAKKRELRQEYFNLRLQQASGQLEKPSRLRDLRRAAARLETALTEKKKGLTIKSRQPQSKHKAETKAKQKTSTRRKA
jgi:large subunit ribosomal protein L29